MDDSSEGSLWAMAFAVEENDIQALQGLIKEEGAGAACWCLAGVYQAPHLDPANGRFGLR